MDSINRQQPENTHKPLQGKEAIDKIQELVKKSETCFFCTDISENGLHTRPMAVQKIDEQGNLWFLSADDSHKNLEIKQDSWVQLFFQGSSHSDFLTVTGHAVISKDKRIIEELWKPVLKTWFTEGKDDPRISVIKFFPKEGYYWDNKHGNAVAFVKMLAGAAVGKTLDDSVEGEIKM